MQTKLTLRMEADLIRRAKTYARRSGRSLSDIVARLFGLIEREDAGETRPSLSPTVRSLVGALRGRNGVSERDYRRHLEKKHR